MTTRGLTIEFRVPRRRDNRRKRPVAPEPVPRIARLLALAHKWEGIVRRGEVRNCAEIARLMGLTRARVTQVCNLTLLDPCLLSTLIEARFSSLVTTRQLHQVAAEPVWLEQRKRWDSEFAEMSSRSSDR
jgi:hypothetical protein